MRRRLFWISIVLLVLVVGAAVALVVTEKPTLDDGRDAADTRWTALRAPLTARYSQLDGAVAAFAAAGGGDRSVAKDLHADLDAWKKAIADDDPEREVAIANRLEGDGRRLRANILASPRIAQVEDVVAKIAAFDGSVPDVTAVRAYNTAVRQYEHDRDATFRSIVARTFGFASRPVYAVGR
jgi:hypothetical protein